MADALEGGRLRRALSLSKLGARMAAGQARRLVARDQGAAHAEMARALVAELGRLKGLPMKIGQILSYMDGVVPTEHEALYQEILGQLRTTSEPMAPEAWRAVFVDELGRPPEEVFESFDPDPIASASIGQVHRAVFEGAPVVFKVQYPGIREATESDLANMDALVGVMRRVMPSVDTRRMIVDFRERLAEEVDYRLEADHQRRFAALYRGDPALLVPEVIDACSTERVLTSRFVEGEPLDRFVASSTQEERDAAGLALFRFAFGSLLAHGLFHADPHPGNLLFRADGTARLCVLDYGCVQPIDEVARRDLRALIRTALDGDDLGPIAPEALGLSVDDVTRDAVTPIVRRVLAPIIEPPPFRFTRGFAAEIGRAVTEAKLALAPRFVTRRSGLVAERPGVMMVVRNLFGLATIWGTLGARGDFRALTEELLRDAPELSRDRSPPPS